MGMVNTCLLLVKVHTRATTVKTSAESYKKAKNCDHMTHL